VPPDPPVRLAEMRDILADIKRQEIVVAAGEAKKAEDAKKGAEEKKVEDDEDMLVADVQRK
jgi:hypothetical protein